jgi:predicted RNase H-like HicB family nuclease
MLTQYIEKAMRHAHYEIMENGRFFGSIAPCRGCWGEGVTLEECRADLQSALEDWIALGLRHSDPFEIIDGIDINYLSQPDVKAHQTT